MEETDFDEVNDNINMNLNMNLKKAPSETSDKSKIPYVDWTHDHENILVDWADKAICYRWLHSKSHNTYSRLNTLFTIPVIIMSTVTGTANFAQDRVPPEYISLFTAIVGAINLLAGILTTIQQFLKISELNEAHRVSSIAWGKFSRNIKIELAKAPQERMAVVQLIKHCKEEFDRLIETSPTVAEKVVKLFIQTFSGGEVKLNEHGQVIDITPKQLAFSELKKPEICDAIETSNKIVYKPKVDYANSKQDLASLSRLMHEKNKLKQIEDFITKFEMEKMREPTLEEIVSNLDSTISVKTINNVITNIRMSKKVSSSREQETFADSLV
jgi:hypothetical protein